jgi:hypothetical protein
LQCCCCRCGMSARPCRRTRFKCNTACRRGESSELQLEHLGWQQGLRLVSELAGSRKELLGIVAVAPVPPASHTTITQQPIPLAAARCANSTNQLQYQKRLAEPLCWNRAENHGALNKLGLLPPLLAGRSLLRTGFYHSNLDACESSALHSVSPHTARVCSGSLGTVAAAWAAGASVAAQRCTHAPGQPDEV